MEWLTQNWVWVALLGAFVAIHFLGHRGHGGHGGRGGGCGRGGHTDRGGRRAPDAEPQRSAGGDAGAVRAGETPGGHRH